MSKLVLNAEATREMLIERNANLQGLPEFGEPTVEAYGAYSESLDFSMSIVHKTNRGKQAIAADLNMNVSELESLCAGKSVLDVGCGEGKFSQDLARLKRTDVTALDYDAEILSKVTERKNLETVLGSGFDIQEVLGDREFDVVISAFSSVHWARNADQKQRAISSALQACKIGGKTIFIPISADIDHREATRNALNRGIIRGYGPASPEQIKRGKDSIAVSDWLEFVGLNTLLSEEEAGKIDCTFVSSRDNARAIPIARAFRNDGDPTQERYSAIVEVLEK